MRYAIVKETSVLSQSVAAEWGIDSVLSLGYDINPDLSGLPSADKPLTIFIPAILDSNNPLGYDGANLGLRILMHYLRLGKTDIDIVLMGIESELNFLLHYEYPNLLKITGMHYIRFNRGEAASFKSNPRASLNPTDYKPFLDNLGLKIPASFKSTHSLTNEWCLYKWNSFMGYEVDNSPLVSHLYFDYLITIETLNRAKNKGASDNLKERISKLPKSRILLIDDKEGWHKFFTDFFQEADIELRCLGADFNKLNLSEIEDCVRSEIRAFQPEVVILDFRLMEDRDANISHNMREISGNKILTDVIKGTFASPHEGFGDQVLIFTATGRIENIMMLQEGNADGFILKEKPENYNGKEVTKSILSSMVSKFAKGIDRARYLIPLNHALNQLATLLYQVPTLNSEIKVSAEFAFQAVRQITQKNELNADTLKVVYLNLYGILEAIHRVSDQSSKDLDYFISTESSRVGLNSDMLNLWDKMRDIRNSIAHGDSIIRKGRLKGTPITAGLLNEWSLKLSEYICEFTKLYFKV